MKHIFIINPAAGAEDNYNLILKGLEPYKDSLDVDFYRTTEPGDATKYIRRWCEKNPYLTARFYACGGDGTLNEVASGVVGQPNASLACFPCGSGNDYVKYYGGKAKFYQLDDLLNGTEEEIDIFRVGNRYALNAVHFGFDSFVANKMTGMRRMPLFGGKNAYTTSVALGLFSAMKNKCKVYADGELLNPSGELLLATVCNGQFVGGSFRCAPRSYNNDGLAEVCVVKPVSILKFLALVQDYTDGKHLDNPAFAPLITYRRAKEVRLEADDGFLYSLDGEILKAGNISVELLHHALKFCVPRGASRIPDVDVSMFHPEEKKGE